jgi:diamine N-acetyltransferase
MLRSERLFLRALEPEDLDFLYKAENDEALWQAGVLQQPISKYTLREYLKNAHLSVAEAGQLRLMICLHDGSPIGMVDLFDYDERNNRAGVGIMLLQNKRGKGLGAEALGLLKGFAKQTLHLHQLYCHVQAENMASLGVFSKSGFTTVGTLQQWLRTPDGYSNVYFMQCIL